MPSPIIGLHTEAKCQRPKEAGSKNGTKKKNVHLEKNLKPMEAIIGLAGGN
jgi:hypothetical protein